MGKIVSFIEQVLEAGLRRIKVRSTGRSNIQTPFESAPFGVDGVPLDKYKALMIDTGVDKSFVSRELPFR